MKNLSLLFVFLGLLSLTSCARWYSVSPDFDRVSRNHQTIAVLPYEVFMLGRIPRNVTEEQIIAIEEAEAIAFQVSMHDEMLRSLRNGRYTLTATLISVQETNARIQNAGLSIDAMHRMSPKELCQILEVDAVYLGRVEKYRYLTDLESFGLDIATDLLRILSRGDLWFIADDTAQDIFVQGTIIEGQNGQALFSAERGFSVDWSNPSNQIIRNINSQIARRIPYRVRNS